MLIDEAGFVTDKVKIISIICFHVVLCHYLILQFLACSFISLFNIVISYMYVYFDKINRLEQLNVGFQTKYVNFIFICHQKLAQLRHMHGISSSVNFTMVY